MVGHRTVLGTVAAVGVIAVALAACGSSSYSGPNIAKGLSATQLAGRSEQGVAQLKSFVLGINGTTAIAVTPKALGTSPAAPVFSGASVPIAASGPVVAPDRFAMALTMTVGGTAIPFTLTQTGGHVYAVARGNALLLPTHGPVVNLQSMIAGIIHAMQMPMTGSTLTVAGVPSIEVSGNINGQPAARAIAPLLRQIPGVASTTPAPGSEQALATALSNGTVHDWVRVSDLRPARVEITASIPNGPAVSPALEHASIELTFTLSDFNQAPPVIPPLHAVPITTTQLSGLI